MFRFDTTARRVVVLAFVSLGAAPAFAQGTPCTVNPTYGVMVLDGGTSVPGFISPGYDVFETWKIGALPTPGASCSNMTRGYSLVFGPVAGADGGEYLPNGAGSGDVEEATNTLTHKRTGSYMFKGSFGCTCGLLGGPTQDVLFAPVLVPPAIVSQPTLMDLTAFTVYGASDVVPVGSTLRLQVTVDTSTCANEHVTYTLSGAGVSKSIDVPGAADCSDSSADATFDFSPTQAGTLSLVASFYGVKSNTVTWTVGGSGGTGGGAGGGAGGNSGSGGDTGTGGSDSGTKPKGGCASADVDPMLVAGAVVLALAARRRR